MNIAQWLYASAKRCPLSPALITGERVEANYAQFARRAQLLADIFRSTYRVNAGDNIIVCMNNRIEYLEVLYAIWWVGAVAVPINAKLHPKEIRWIVNHADSNLLIISDDIDAAPALSISQESNATLLSVDTEKFQTLRDVGQVEGNDVSALSPPQPRKDKDLA